MSLREMLEDVPESERVQLGHRWICRALSDRYIPMLDALASQASGRFKSLDPSLSLEALRQLKQPLREILAELAGTKEASAITRIGSPENSVFASSVAISSALDLLASSMSREELARVSLVCGTVAALAGKSSEELDLQRDEISGTIRSR